MKLSELQQIIDRAKNLGFKPEEVEVIIKKGYTTLKVGQSEACVRVSEQGAKPVLTINVTEPSVSSYLDR